MSGAGSTSSADESAQDAARAFAEDLARLRELHGSPSFERMHRAIRHVAGAAGSKNTFHRMVTNPGRIYGPEFVRGFVLALGLDSDAADEWERRRAQALQRYQLSRDSAAASDHERQWSAVGKQRGRRRPAIIFATIAAFVLVATLTLSVFTNRNSPSASSPRMPSEAARSSPVKGATPPLDGADPVDTGCSLDPAVVVLDSAEVDYSGVPVGLDELVYSPRCGVAWPRFQPFPAATIPAGAIIQVYVVRPASRALRVSFQALYVGAPVYGNMLRNTEYCVYAAATIDVKGKKLPASRTHCFRGKTPEE